VSNPPPPSWTLACPWCPWRLVVFARGMRGGDPGAGVEAAERGRRHAEEHGRTWEEFLRETEPRRAGL
jgi:hypothetical protein